MSRNHVKPTFPLDRIRLKDYQPRSVFKIPETPVEQVRYAVWHCHIEHEDNEMMRPL